MTDFLLKKHRRECFREEPASHLESEVSTLRSKQDVGSGILLSEESDIVLMLDVDRGCMKCWNAHVLSMKVILAKYLASDMPKTPAKKILWPRPYCRLNQRECLSIHPSPGPWRLLLWRSLNLKLPRPSHRVGPPCQRGPFLSRPSPSSRST